jgi:hypothetical protein
METAVDPLDKVIGWVATVFKGTLPNAIELEFVLNGGPLVPTPLRPITMALLAALLAIFSCPAAAPTAWGEKITLN